MITYILTGSFDLLFAYMLIIYILYGAIRDAWRERNVRYLLGSLFNIKT